MWLKETCEAKIGYHALISSLFSAKGNPMFGPVYNVAIATELQLCLSRSM